MAMNPYFRKPLKVLTSLAALTVVLAGLLVGANTWGTGSWTPKLGLDLEGGTQIVLAPKLVGNQKVSSDQLDQARGIIVQRIDSNGVSGAEVTTRERGWSSVRTGMIVGATNPKTIVFFAAFLPQFVDDSKPAAPQLLLLGGLFAVMAAASDSCWALASSRAKTWFARKPHRLDRLGVTGGVMMIGLGAALATTGNRA